MTLNRRWVASCDRDDCPAILVVPPGDSAIFGDDKGTAGIYTCDQGWDAAPNRREVFCPEHSSSVQGESA